MWFLSEQSFGPLRRLSHKFFSWKWLLKSRTLLANQNWVFFNIQNLLAGSTFDFNFFELDRKSACYVELDISQYLLSGLILWMQMNLSRRKSKFLSRISQVSWLFNFFSLFSRRVSLLAALSLCFSFTKDFWMIR